MAGDWIKFEKSTLDKPEVFEIAEALGIDPDAVVGKLLRVWNWFDDHSEDGNASVTVRPLLDRFTGVAGFSKSMEVVGWLEVEGDQMLLPNFERHNGQTAKNRCSTNRRVAKSRAKGGKSNGDAVTDVTGEPLQKPLPEKRREEKSIKSVSITEGEPKPASPKSPKFTPPTIEEFTGYLVEEMPKINAEWTEERVKIAAQLQFETYAENSWKDGNNKQIKNWKLKAKNTFAFKKPWNYGNNKKSMPSRGGTIPESEQDWSTDGLKLA